MTQKLRFSGSSPGRVLLLATYHTTTIKGLQQAAPEPYYMNPEQLAFFKQRLMELYDSTCERTQEAKEQMVTSMDFSYPSDHAYCEERPEITLKIVDR